MRDNSDVRADKNDAFVLPYRTTAEEVVAWVGVRALGKAVGVGALGGEKNVEGAVATATALGFAAGAALPLTDAGRKLALADPAERRALLRAALLAYPPYRALLAEVRHRGDAVTTAEWVETWWATQGLGNSASNRREGAATLGRLAEWVGLGNYIPGRRGHPTRIEWTLPDADAVAEPRDPPRAGALTSGGSTGALSGGDAPVGEVPESVGPESAVPAASPPSPGEAGFSAGGALNRIAVRLTDGTTARLELPLHLPTAEKRRLLELLDLLIADE